ncbi:hypothetical protein HJC23_003277 [Cyclotella cryptica]|uniref:Sulfotransferase domain-containing protein n=1 Tax=Cyclotella cryptica TaxID=29204 RepID=A0ABD3QYD1_9STRA|eukprot:CCRYP_000812-RA/>CCRYP_000812-RA protein AED:0.03 eAED:0.03 QI:32/1/1/1/1/1/2/45/499
MSNLDDIDLRRPSSDDDYGIRSSIGTTTVGNSAAFPPQSTHSNEPRQQNHNNNNNNNTAITRGNKPTHLFSILKRPRKNVKKRSIQEMEPLQSIREDEDGPMDKDNSSRRIFHAAVHDPHRAPKAALGIFLLVCCVGSYQLLLDYWSGRLVDGSEYALKEPDVTNSFLNPSNITSDVGRSFDTGAVLDPETIAETPTILFDHTVFVPPELNNLANVFQEQYNSSKNKLFLWHIPRSGSTTIKRIAANCLGLTLASEVGKSEVDLSRRENTLKILEGSDGMHFANVDMSYPDGIAHANALHIGTDPRIDLVSSAYLYHAAGIFDPDHKGFVFAMFRHPIERAVSLFYNMRRYSQYAKIIGPVETVEMYARSSLVENNWMTRFLSNTLAGQLRPEHEAIAKEVLRTKCIIGLLTEKTESMRRLELFFQGKVERTQRREECTEKLLYWDWPGKNRHDQVEEGSEAWQRLYDQNTFDIRLYEYAEQLFVAQAKIFNNFTMHEA